MSVIKFRVPAIPVAQPRVKAAFRGGHAAVYTPSTVKCSDGSRKPHPIHAFKAVVKMVASEHYTGAPIAGPVRLSWVAVFPRPSGKVWKSKPMPRYPHTSKPDRDNLDKAIMDCLKGIVLTDDAQVCGGTLEKYVASGYEQPHVEITIEALTPDPKGG